MTIGYAKRELQGDWAVFDKIARFFVYKVPYDDREDFFHDMLVEMVKVKAKYEATEKPLTEASLMKVASYELKEYWVKRIYRLFGIDCGNCTSEQRHECRTMRLASECPKGKARHLLSLDKPVKNDDGNKPISLQDLIANRTEIDLDAQLDARRILQALPKRLVQIGYKICAEIPLKTKEKEYLKLWRKTYSARFDFGRDHLDERTLGLLRKNPQGMTRSDPARFHLRRDHLDERILGLLRKNPRGMTRGALSMRLQATVCECIIYLNRLIERQQTIAVKRWSTCGRPCTPLYVIAGATIPEMKNFAAERDERIRQAYFRDGWSIKRINRELHHDKRTIHRAIYGIHIKRR